MPSYPSSPPLYTRSTTTSPNDLSSRPLSQTLDRFPASSLYDRLSERMSLTMASYLARRTAQKQKADELRKKFDAQKNMVHALMIALRSHFYEDGRSCI